MVVLVYTVHVFFSGLGVIYNTRWQKTKVDLEPSVDVFVFAATRGGNSMYDDEGDICVDDVSIQYGNCCKLFFDCRAKT